MNLQKLVIVLGVLLFLAQTASIRAAAGTSGAAGAETLGGGALRIELSDGNSPSSVKEKADSERDAGFGVAAGGGNTEWGYAVQQTTNGGYIVAGYTTSYGAGAQDILLLNYDAGGALVWIRTAGGELSDCGYSLTQTKDGGYVVTGVIGTSGPGSNDVALLKYDESGALIWARTTDVASDDRGCAVQQTSEGGYIVTGFTNGVGVADWDILLLKYDASGGLTWGRTIGGTDGDFGEFVQQTADGGYILAGATHYGSTNSDVLLAKFDASGAMTWIRTAGGTDTEEGYSVQQTADGGYIAAGRTDSYGAGDSDVLLLKYAADGVLEWARTAGGTGRDVGLAVRQTRDGDYIVAGQSSSFGAQIGIANVFVLKFTGSGTLIWAKAIGGTFFDQGAAVQQTADGGYCVAGTTFSYGAGAWDVLLLKLNAEGSIENCSAIESCNPVVDAPDITVGTPDLTISNTSGTVSTPTLTLTMPNVTNSVFCAEIPTATPAMTPTAVATPSPASTMTPSATDTPTQTATQPPPTETPPEIPEFGVYFEMPSDHYIPGDTFYLNAFIANPGATVSDAPLFIVLEIVGQYWFWPTWVIYPPDITYQNVDVPTGVSYLSIIEPFIWPENAGVLDGICLYGAIVNDAFTEVRGHMGVACWGYGT